MADVIFPQEWHVDLTAGCNARCVMCSVYEDSPQPFLAGDNFLDRLVGLARRAGRFRIGCSSESLLHPRSLDTIRRLKSAGARVQILTNGKLLAGVAEDLCEAGLDVLRISLDSLDPALLESRRRGVKLDGILEGLRRIVAWKRRTGAKRPVLGLAVTLMRDNLAELPGLVRFCAEQDIRVLDYGQVFVWRSDPGLLARSLFLAQAEADAVVARAERLAREHGIHFHPRFFSRGDIIYTGDIAAEPDLQDVNYSFPGMEPCTVHRRDAWITPRGDVMLCNRFRVGNLLESTPEALFSNPDTVRIMTAAGKDKLDICAGCTNCYIRPPDDIRGHFAELVLATVGEARLRSLAARGLGLAGLEQEMEAVLAAAQGEA